MKKLLVLCIASLLTLTGCQSFNAQDFSKRIVDIGDVVIAMECTPVRTALTDTTNNILTIVAADSKTANNVKKYLEMHNQVANQLCPLFIAIRATVGTVDQNARPDSIIAVDSDTKAALHK